MRFSVRVFSRAASAASKNTKSLADWGTSMDAELRAVVVNMASDGC